MTRRAAVTRGKEIIVAAPHECRTLADIRREIDRLDERLVALVAERTGYIARAAELKQRAEDIRDEARIEDVVAKVRAAAERRGLRPDLAETVWRQLVETSIRYEDELFHDRLAKQTRPDGE